MKQYKDEVKSKRDNAIEVIKSKLDINDIRALYDFFNVDDDVQITMENGVESLTPFGADGPSLTNSSIEMYSLDRYARQFSQTLIRMRFNQLINPPKPEKDEAKPKTPK